jgi:hypothetical protein
MILVRRIPIWIVSLSLFLFGLHIHQVSQIVIILFSIFVFMHWKFTLFKDFTVQFFILSIFVITYYTIITTHGFLDPHQSIYRSSIILLSYTLGYSLVPGSVFQEVTILIFMVLGLTLVAFLSVINSTTYEIFFVENRTTVELIFSKEIDKVAGPTLGMFANVGISLFPSIFFINIHDPSKIKKFFLLSIIIILFVLGCYTNFALQNRSIIFIVILSFFSTFYIYFNSSRSSDSILRKISYLFLLLLLLNGIYYLAFEKFSQFGFYNRLISIGFSSPRYSSWIIMLKHLPINLLVVETCI